VSAPYPTYTYESFSDMLKWPDLVQHNWVVFDMSSLVRHLLDVSDMFNPSSATVHLFHNFMNWVPSPRMCYVLSIRCLDGILFILKSKTCQWALCLYMWNGWEQALCNFCANCSCNMTESNCFHPHYTDDTLNSLT